MNDPITAWALQVYLRDYGFWLWLGPSSRIYGGFAACAGRSSGIYRNLWLTEVVDAGTIQDAARKAAEQICDLSGFEEWRAEWEKHALVDGEDT